jgi:DNA polymerase (family 10)
MPVHNSEIADIFSRIADMLEIKDENRFRIRAYRNVARVVNGMSENIADKIQQGENISKIPNVGSGSAEKIEEIVKTGKCRYLEELERSLPAGLSQIMKIAGLGGKKVAVLYKKLSIRSIDDLENAAKEEKIQSLEGFGEKTEQSIIDGIQRLREGSKRFRWNDAEEYAVPLYDYLRKHKAIKKCTIAGSFRRRRETVHDIDILATTSKNKEVMNYFVAYEEVDRVISQGTTRSSVLLRCGLQVDLRLVSNTAYGAALHYFTGSQPHNIAIRKIGVSKKLKINEYGVFKGKKRIAGKSEKEIFESVQLRFIEPELREDRGEIDAARSGSLPELITLKNIRGDLHVHSRYSDGKLSIEAMVKAAAEMGYSYVAITDHTKQVRIANGLDEKRLRKQIEEIDRVNEQMKDILILKGSEVDILEDGSLDLPDSVLKHLDITVCSIHSKFNLSSQHQTNRIIKALNNPYLTILGHPTGRMINERQPYDFDMDAILREAKKSDSYIEINSQPFRLDLSDTYCKAAKEMGIKFSIATDAHTEEDLKLMRHGIGQARRGWIEANDVINTGTRRQLKRLINVKR